MFREEGCLEKQRIGNGVFETVRESEVRKGRMPFCL